MPLERTSRLQMLVKDAEAILLDDFKRYVAQKYGENQLTNRIMSMIYRELDNAKQKGEYKPRTTKEA